MSKKWPNIESVREAREKLAEKYESGLPDYLVDYFDHEEQKLLNEEFFRNRYKQKFQFTPEERYNYVQEGIENFWKRNKFELVKKPRRVGSHLKPVFEEAPVNEEAVEEEVELSKEDIDTIKAVCSESLYTFAVRYFSHYLKSPSSSLHKYLYSYLERNLNKKNRRKGFKHAVAAPRSNAKSSIVSNILPIWCIVYGKKNFIILLSDTAGQAEDFLADIKRELEHNELLKRDFPEACGKGLTWRQNEIITKNDIKLMALGTLSKVRGRRYVDKRPDLIIGDDLENSELLRSPTSREFLRNNWFNKDVLFCGNNQTDFLVVGTVIGRESLLWALLDPNEYPDWTSRHFKAVEKFSTCPLWGDWENLYRNVFDAEREKTARQFFEEHEEEMLEGTKVLWPEGDPYYNLMVYKLSDESGFSSEKMNNPLDPTKILMPFDKLHFESFVSNPEVLAILNDKRNRAYGALDPSLGKTATSDYSVIITIIRDRKTGNLFVVDINIKRRPVEKQVEAIIKLHEKYNYKKFGIETNGFQIALKDNLVKVSKAEGIYMHNIIEEVQNYSDKHLRIQGLAPFVLDGTIIFDKNKYGSSQQYKLGVEQISTYTKNASFDDSPDLLEQLVRICTTKKFKLITKQTGQARR